MECSAMNTSKHMISCAILVESTMISLDDLKILKQKLVMYWKFLG